MSKAYYGFKILRFGFGFGFWLSVQHALLLHFVAGGGLTSPRGITAARPPFYFLRIGVRLLGFIDFGDFGDLKFLGLVLGGS